MNGLNVKNEPFAWLRVEFLSESLLYGDTGVKDGAIQMNILENRFFQYTHCIELDEESAQYALSLAADHCTLAEEAGVAFMTRRNREGNLKFGVIAKIFREDSEDKNKVTCALPAVWNARLETDLRKIHRHEVYFPFTSPKGKGYFVYDKNSNVIWDEKDLARLAK